MASIVVTTPKQNTQRAEQEAKDCIRNEGGSYFRKLPYRTYPKSIQVGDRVYYILNNFVRGFCLVQSMEVLHECKCETSGVYYGAGFYIFMDAASWQWVAPAPMKGFQGFRYAQTWMEQLPIVGGWLDPMPPEA
jgi:hypothetical protein